MRHRVNYSIAPLSILESAKIDDEGVHSDNLLQADSEFCP
jgi:hypothetical protein